jgi:hypothetical protein
VPDASRAQAEDTYFQANNWASYDDWRRARDQWDYFCEPLFPSLSLSAGLQILCILQRPSCCIASLFELFELLFDLFFLSSLHLFVVFVPSFSFVRPYAILGVCLFQ